MYLLLLLFPATILPWSIAGLSPGELLGTERLALLAAQGSLAEIQYVNPQPLLIPAYPELQGMVAGIQEALGPSIMAEKLFLYPKPAGSAFPSWSEAERRSLYNGALSLSTLAGIEYFSSSRAAMRVFYETSTVIDGPSSKRPLPDPVYAVPPAELLIYARQKDLTFGDTIYQYRYYARSDALIFTQENLSAMTVGIIPVVGKNKLRSIVAALDGGDCLILYTVSMAKAASLPSIRDRAGQSFSTRAEAVIRWFSAKADAAFASR